MKSWRLVLVQIFFLFIAVSITGRLLYWQVVKKDVLSARAAGQHEVTTHLEAKRGRLFATDDSLIVGNEPAFLLYANLNEFNKQYSEKEDREDQADKITEALFSEILGSQKDSKKLSKVDKEKLFTGTKKEIIKKLNLQNLVWVPLEKKVSAQTKEKLEQLKISSLGFEELSKRFYPEGSLASQLIGFVGNDTYGNDAGYFGLEGYYDRELKGRAGRLIQELDASGNPILTNDEDGSFPTDGFDLVTTIDRNVQYVVEEEIQKAVKKFGAKLGSVVVLDPKTGGILALANSPSFDQDKWQSYEGEDFKNSAISDIYEPGSTFKLVTIASALDAQAVKPNTVCPCKGPIKVSGYEVQTWNNKYHPNATILEILQHSDNVGAAFAGEKLGTDRFLEYIKNFGFGSSLGVDLQGEEKGLVKERQNWSKVDLVTASFGQGLSVTALQMTSALSVIANDGKLMKPFVVKKIKENDTEINIEPKVIRQVIKPETASLMKELLLAAVEGGEARNIIPKGYRVAGKTGTAQVPIAGHYDPSKATASFVGFGPVEDPKFVAIVKFVDPTPIYGAETAEPTFFEIAKRLYPYWGIPVRTSGN
ncbi:MAG: penicillin-binding protein 2 [Candidatus Woykebacteria bacterium]